jgi:hypothetical protein
MADTVTHLAVAYLDFYYGSEKITDSKALIATCLSLASKYDELDDNIPDIKSIIKTIERKVVSEEDYEEVKKIELKILTLTDWDLGFVMPLHLLKA